MNITESVGIKNRTCIYCGVRASTDIKLTREHIIGQNFVPRYAFRIGPALVANACEACNSRKAELEDDISAITLLPGVGESVHDPRLLELIQRKARGSRSRQTKKPVGESYVDSSIKGSLMPGVEVSFGFVGPPALSIDRVRALAALHLQGFCYWTTFDPQTRTGRYLATPITFFPLIGRRDWGNVISRHFAELTQHWDKTFWGEFADGYYRVVIRKEPRELKVHSFALEWNKNLRIKGFLGEREDVRRYEVGYPEHAWKYAGPKQRFRLEIPVAEEDDILFN